MRGPVQYHRAIGLITLCFSMCYSLTAVADPALVVDRGSPDVMGLSGERGDRVSQVEELSRVKAAIGLTVLLRGDVACGVALEGRKAGANANFETMTLSRCSTGRGSDDRESAEAGWGGHMSGVHLCSSRDDPFDVGGFEIETREVEDDGVSDRSQTERGYDGADCDQWAGWSSCDEGFLMTGLIVHFANRDRNTKSPDALVGLQAVCREVRLEP